MKGTDERQQGALFQGLLLSSFRQTPTCAVIVASQLKGYSMALESRELGGGPREDNYFGLHIFELKIFSVSFQSVRVVC